MTRISKLYLYAFFVQDNIERTIIIFYFYLCFIKERSNKLKEKYLNSADFNQNPLIIELREDYLIYKLNNHNSRIKTLLD